MVAPEETVEIADSILKGSKQDTGRRVNGETPVVLRADAAAKEERLVWRWPLDVGGHGWRRDTLRLCCACQRKRESDAECRDVTRHAIFSFLPNEMGVVVPRVSVAMSP